MLIRWWWGFLVPAWCFLFHIVRPSRLQCHITQSTKTEWLLINAKVFQNISTWIFHGESQPPCCGVGLHVQLASFRKSALLLQDVLMVQGSYFFTVTVKPNTFQIYMKGTVQCGGKWKCLCDGFQSWLLHCIFFLSTLEVTLIKKKSPN